MTDRGRPLAFINKDATNFTHRSADEAHAISSHVAKNYIPWSRLERLRSVNVPTKHNTEPLTEKASESEITEEKRRTPSNKSRPSATHDVQRNTTRRTAIITTPSTAPPKRPLRHLAHQIYPNPVTLLQLGNSDPFSVASVEITPLNSYLITFWQAVFVQTVIPEEILHKAPTSAVTCNDESAADVVDCPERLHFLLAWALMLQSAGTPDSQKKKQLEVEALTHKAAGMASLQKSLARMTKLTAVRTVWHLMGAEFYCGNLTAASTHCNAIVNIVTSMGGLNSLPWKLKKIIVVSDMILSASMNKSTAFDVGEWDPGSVIPILSISEAELLARNPLIQQELHESVPLRLFGVFMSYKELLAVNRIAADIKDISRLRDLSLWAQMRQFALGTHVTNIKAVLDGLPTSAENFLEKVTCVAVDYFLQLLWLKSQTKRCDFSPFHHSQGSLQILQDASELEPSSLTLWILFVAAAVEFVLRQRGQTSSFFARRFVSMLEILQLGSLKQIRQSLSQFLYEPEILDLYLHALTSPIHKTDSDITGTK